MRSCLCISSMRRGRGMMCDWAMNGVYQFFPIDALKHKLGAGKGGVYRSRGYEVIGVKCGCTAFGMVWITAMVPSSAAG